MPDPQLMKSLGDKESSDPQFMRPLGDKDLLIVRPPINDTCMLVKTCLKLSDSQLMKLLGGKDLLIVRPTIIEKL